jgi:mono/diheme cytochrome c family protein
MSEEKRVLRLRSASRSFAQDGSRFVKAGWGTVSLKRIFLGAAVVLSGAFIYQGVEAAQQSPNSQAETSPPVKQDASAEIAPGAKIYAQKCAVCHGNNREGNLPGFPPLQSITRQMTNDKIVTLVHAGKGRMPAFPQIEGQPLNELLGFLASPVKVTETKASGPVESGPVAAGDALFHQNCAFCHGRDAQGGESGPDLTQSKLVLGDKSGQETANVVRNGRPETKMPAFNLSTQELESLVEFLRFRVKAAASHPGGRRGVSAEDLQTGDADAGRKYFEGVGGCMKCHSATGDLKGVASRFQGLQLEEQMLYPRRTARQKLTVTLPGGQIFSGVLAYRDEFVVGMHDEQGTYRSWRTDRVKYTIDDPAEAHVEQFPKYTDKDVHDLMKYLQTLK